MAEEKTDISGISVQHALRGIEYPAKKEDLLSCAKSNDASDNVIDLIERFDRDDYGGPQDVMKEYGKLA